MVIRISSSDTSDGDFVRIARSPTGLGFRLEAAQYLPHPRQRVFEFFSDASNLQILTSAWLHFAVRTPTPIRIENGTRIDYSLRMHGFPIRWQSHISHWEPPIRFVDEQTRGPYRSWRHEHAFEATDGGVICKDTIEYSVFGGSLIHTLFVRGDLSRISGASLVALVANCVGCRNAAVGSWVFWLPDRTLAGGIIPF